MSNILDGLLAIERYNDQFRRLNPKGRFPICKPILGGNICERCGTPINIPSLADNRPPCPAVLPEQRWGEDWKA